MKISVDKGKVNRKQINWSKKTTNRSLRTGNDDNVKILSRGPVWCAVLSRRFTQEQEFLFHGLRATSASNAFWSSARVRTKGRH